MKKLFALLLTLVTLMSLAACDLGNNKNPADGTKDANGSQILDGDDLEDLDEALDILETLKPEGWDENNYGMYIYDVWDSEFLPDVMPLPIEGIKIDQTVFKDYDHDTLSGSYDIGPIWYESKEDYRQYGVAFYATVEQYDEFLNAAEAKGFTGGERTNRDEDQWWEACYYNETGWFMYITFKKSTYENEYDGFVSVSLTDSIFERPEAVSGNPLPVKGMPDYDYTNGTYIYDEINDEVEFDLAKDTFPADNHYSIFFSYYGTGNAYADEYADTLVSAGWTIIQENGEESDYYALLEKDGQYAQVDFIPYDGILQVGFASMVESLQY